MPEFRAHITVPGLPVENEHKWDRLLTVLDRDHHDLGPVLSWDGTSMRVTLAADADSGVEASEALSTVVLESLCAAGLEHLAPAAIELERIAPEP